jgi:transposase-like protein
MGMTGISKSQVSRLCEEIDQRVNAFLQRPLEGAWPCLWIDTTSVAGDRDRGEGARSRSDRLGSGHHRGRREHRWPPPRCWAPRGSAAASTFFAARSRLAYMGFHPDHWAKIPSTNPLERLNGAIKRRHLPERGGARATGRCSPT